MTADDKAAFAQAIGKLAITHREKDPDAAMMRSYFEALGSVDIEFVVAAAQQLMTDVKWFPAAKVWRDAALKIERERVDAQRAVIRKLKTPLCLDCNDTGWADKGDNRVGKCDCAKQRRLEVLGRRPLPALPESTEAPRVIDVQAVASALASTKRIR